ncbi:phage portal protein [Staphylococcus agnetis]|uniref:phage portal protein n=1 Tax=Staphylococcus agnetis TaxID=985762 RepID=UPI0021D2385C|nr:phage portal protein [Staphylococcus agnetis]UXU59004.1 phage portal protein [Staphylococcus agnetis]UXU61329.1 phage portal protein [Staphylococcus agnetis]
MYYHITNKDNIDTLFSREANKDITAVDLDEFLGQFEKINDMLNVHRTQHRPRLEILESYYLGNNVSILTGQRRKLSEMERKADHRATHNFAKYISQFIVGYLTGNPVTITHDADNKTQDAIIELNDINDADAVNSDVALDLSIYGRAFEIIFRDEDGNDRFMTLDPKNTFVVYNHDIDKKLLAGVRYYDSVDKDNVSVSHVEVYTPTHVHHYQIKNGELNQSESYQHFYGEVPIIEYVNNKFKQGDFENIISLIDLYDSAQSDTANYTSDLQDAMLAVVGNVEMDGEDAQRFRDANMVHVKPEINANGGTSSADVKYIYKQYDVNGSEAYKSRLQDDIHKFTNTPNMNDEKFSGTQSGEAMKYKLFGLEQVRAVKERLFKKGLYKRYRLLFNYLAISGTKVHDASGLDIRFTPNLPKSMRDNVEVVNMLAGVVSEKTRLALLDFLDDPQAELDRIEEERKNEQNNAPGAYPETFTNPNQQEDNSNVDKRG